MGGTCPPPPARALWPRRWKSARKSAWAKSQGEELPGEAVKLRVHQSPGNLPGPVGAEVEEAQLRIAETEKYAHVTFFFNGGSETVFPGEDRVLVPSPKVATYDLQANDLTMHGWFRETGCPEIVVANKLDKLKKSQIDPALALIRETLELEEED